MENDNITLVVNVQIASNRIILYKSLEGYYRGEPKSSFRDNNYDNGKVKGKLSKNAQKRIKNIIITWISTIQFYLLSKGYSLSETRKHFKFITLTLSGKQFHDDKYIKRFMLNGFITLLKRKYGLKNYLWVAETQKNGNIHFHMIVDINIHHKTIRNAWNALQRRHGYLDNFFKVNKHYNANSTDVHVSKKVDNLPAYLSKEMSKGQGSRPIIGKLWGCSDNLLKLKSFETLLSSGTMDMLDKLCKVDKTRELQDEWFSVIFFESVKYFEVLDFNELPEMYLYYKNQMKLLFYE